MWMSKDAKVYVYFHILNRLHDSNDVKVVLESRILLQRGRIQNITLLFHTNLRLINLF